MKIDIYGRGVIEVLREGDQWVIYTVGEGKRVRSNDFVIPSHFAKDEVLVFLADLFHESATPQNSELKIIE